MKTAVLLFNLGGPDGPDAVQPFLFNLFNDPAIIRTPGWLRWFLARLISRRRAPVAREIYAKLGGGSPLLENTEAQAEALEALLGPDFKCFIVMRYWHPMAAAQAQAVKAWTPDRIVAVPLYPQYSSTTTGSSMKDWGRAADAAGIGRLPVHAVCCWPVEPGFVEAVAGLVSDAMEQIGPGMPVRVLFSAHGLPQQIVDEGDPYQWQVERSVAAVRQRLDAMGHNIDHVVCYQSRVGPLKWLEPSTDNEVKRAGQDGVAVIMVPIAFVSEHSETLVELDIEYGELAERVGVPAYFRVETASLTPSFIEGLASLVSGALERPAGGSRSGCGGGRICPASSGFCPAKSMGEG